MSRFLKYKYQLSAILCSLLFFACNDVVELKSTKSLLPDETVRIELFTRATEHSLPETKVFADETGIEKNPWILVFEGNDETAQFVEAAQAGEIAEYNDGKKYVYLTARASACQLLVLANPQSKFYVDGTPYPFTSEDFEIALAGKSLKEACEKLVTEPLSDPQATIPFVPGMKLPMSDVVSVPEIKWDTKIETSNMQRVTAKIAVTNFEADFTFNGIMQVSAPKWGLWHHLSGTPLRDNTSDFVTYTTGTSSNLVDAVGESTVDDPVYIYESRAIDGAYLIIKGKYKGEEGFYKMAFVNSEQDNILDIIRNRYYLFNIKSVTGRGFATVKEAADAAPTNTNIDYELTLRDEYSYEIVANNDYYLGVTNSYVRAYVVGIGLRETFTAFTLITDNKNSSIKGTITASPEITIVSPTPDQNGNYIFQPNTPIDVNVWVSFDCDTGTIEVKLGNLKHKIWVSKQKTLYDSMDNYISGTIKGGYDTILFCNTFINDGKPHYFTSAYVVTDTAVSWLKLMPSSNVIRNDSSSIYSDDGIINLYIPKHPPRTERYGYIYMTTGKWESRRLKMFIRQDGTTGVIIGRSQEDIIKFPIQEIY